ncbi:hypothetical protein CFC21_075071 [Triticum aestivum]|uniref:Cation/H+ exchanger domain-containing protein n=2 Tax=Triticum aestivum TaxID=4565 RepID=A0A9R1HPY3_WHEAT|nr:uncharacterized protein LOC123117794 [Triticum aestivum]KAF7009565.1 hypothetical protein CFC21_024084 [Triticum aestivum]KAF7069441.1 hypothetical protein CFC21_075071 [Triticum aestivum]
MDDELQKRTAGFAEGMVVMVCPVLVAIALDKVDLKVYGHHAFSAMLTMAAVTLIIGICPFLICWFSRTFVRPVPVTAILATLSSCSLLILTCFIAQLVVPKNTLIILGVVFGFLVLLRAVEYYRRGDFDRYPQDKILNESHEFLTGVTGVLFLGLEGLALEGHDDPMFEKGGAVAVASFIVCCAGVCMMYLEMTPPIDFKDEKHVVSLTLTLDSIMAGGTFTLLMVVMFQLMGPPALVLFLPPVLIIGDLVYRVTVHDTAAGDDQVSEPAASLELTKVTFIRVLGCVNNSHPQHFAQQVDRLFPTIRGSSYCVRSLMEASVTDPRKDFFERCFTSSF